MSLDLSLLGRKLLRCREHLQLSHGEVSAKTGVLKDRLSRFENGTLEPTGDEILILSDFFKQDYQYLISNIQRSASEQVDILYRKFGRDFSKDDRWTIQEFIYLCECEQFVLDSLQFTRTPFNFHPQGTFFKKHGEDAAIFLRREIGYRENEIIGDIYYELRKLGIHVFRRRLKNSEISGLFINHPWAGRCILVNYDEDIYRQNFTIAHEAGHAVLDFDEMVNISRSGDSLRDLKEVRANTFASRFLIPGSVLQSLRGISLDKDLILDLAIKLKVNIQPLLIALKDQQVIDSSTYDFFSKLRIPQEAKVDPELQGISERIAEGKRYLLERGLSTFYVRHCHEGYEKKLVSASKLAEMLLTTESILPQILGFFNLKLHYDN